jgi:hypothetical protein
MNMLMMFRDWVVPNKCVRSKALLCSERKGEKAIQVNEMPTPPITSPRIRTSGMGASTRQSADTMSTNTPRIVDHVAPMREQRGLTKRALTATDTKLIERMPPKKVFEYPKESKKRL